MDELEQINALLISTALDEAGMEDIEMHTQPEDTHKSKTAQTAAVVAAYKALGREWIKGDRHRIYFNDTVLWDGGEWCIP